MMFTIGLRPDPITRFRAEGTRSHIFVLAMTTLGYLAVASPARAQNEVARDRAADASQAAESFGEPAPDAPPELRHWGQLAGVWECEIAAEADDGTVQRSAARWTWRYVLGGQAVQDSYVGLGSNGQPGFRGFGLRVYHADKRRWDITWADSNGPNDRGESFSYYLATSEPDRVEMRYVEGDPAWRTVFYDISEDTFDWLNEPSGLRMRCDRAR